MWKALKEDWKRLRAARPGDRFRKFYNRRQRRDRGAWSVGRVAALVVGVVLVLVGPVVGMVPGPGGLLVFALGLALLATQFRWMAGVLDRAEPKVRAGWRIARSWWAGLSVGVQIAVAFAVVAIGAAGGYVAYGWMFG